MSQGKRKPITLEKRVEDILYEFVGRGGGNAETIRVTAERIANIARSVIPEESN